MKTRFEQKETKATKSPLPSFSLLPSVENQDIERKLMNLQWFSVFLHSVVKIVSLKFNHSVAALPISLPGLRESNLLVVLVPLRSNAEF
jgi:hypothetical protein